MSSQRMSGVQSSLLNIHPRTRNSFKVILLALISVSAFLFHIWFRTKVLTSGYHVGKLRHELSKLESQIISLGVEKNRLMGPDQLELLVRQYNERGIHLGPPKKSQTVYLPRETQKP